MDAFAEATGLPSGMVKYLACLLTTLPASMGYRLCPTGLTREVYAIATGISLCAYAYGLPGMCQLALTPIATYILAAILPRNVIALSVAFITFVHLISCHVSNASGAAWSEGNIDFTGSLMIIVLKCTAFAFNLSDGHLSKTKMELSVHAADCMLMDLPNPTTFFAYVLDPTTVLIGPFLEFKEFSNFLHFKGVYAEDKPSVVGTALRGFAVTVAMAAGHIVVSGYFPVNSFTVPEWEGHPLWWKCVLVYMVPFQARLKYYFCWCLSHTALKCSGAAYLGRASGRDMWQRGENVRPLGVELATSSVEYPLNWNICTGNWLRHYVYDRQQAPGKKPGFRALVVTQTVSGVWHGLYAGYWMFFVSTAFMLQGSRFIFRLMKATPRSMHLPIKILHGALSAVQLNYLAVAFLVLEFQPTLAVWRQLGFVGHVTLMIVVAASMVIPTPKPTKKS